MYIPAPSTPPLPASSNASPPTPPHLQQLSLGFGNGHDLSPEDWSSLIGIVTAIVGNVLISFALNTQRYAHLRLSRESDTRAKERRRDRKRRRNGRKNGAVKSYGTQQMEQQEEIAEARARDNVRYGPANGQLELEEEEEAQEGDALIPSLESSKASLSTVGSSAASANMRNEKGEDEGKGKSYLKSPIWWLGIAMMVLGEAGNFLAYGFAPASIVSPLGVVALISNCLIAPLLLHEKFRWRDAVGVVIAVAGCVTVVLSASDSNPRLDPDTIWELITTWEFETYLGITISLIVVLLFASNKYGEKSILIDLGLVGLFGGYTALSTKGVASLLSNKIWRVITFPITYLLLAVLILTAVMQIKYVNRALQRFNATMVIPTQFVLFTLSVIIGSAVLYRDFERESADDAGKFVGGCALTFLGVWCITSGRSDDNDGDEELEGDLEEDAVDLIDHEGVQAEVHERPDDEHRSTSPTKSSAKTAPAQSRRLQSAADIQPSLIITPDFQPSTPSNPSHLTQSHTLSPGPANRSAIHATSASDLSSTSTTDPSKHPPMHATTSAPLIPTLTPRPTTPLRNPTSPSGTSTTQSPRTPQPRLPPDQQQAQQHQNLSPARAALARNRNSITTLLPDLGPLTSPLSSSLSAIVADSLRRGVDHPHAHAGNPNRTLRRNTASRSGVQQAQQYSSKKRHSIASGTLSADEDEGQGGGSRSVRKSTAGTAARSGDETLLRARSLSATLGDLFTRGNGGGNDGGGAGNGGNGKRREGEI